MRESKLETRLRVAVEKKGGLLLKLWCVSVSGLPDRMALLPGGRCVFVEVKAPGESPKKLQKYWQRRMRNLGFEAVVVDSVEGVNQFILDYVK